MEQAGLSLEMRVELTGLLLVLENYDPSPCGCFLLRKMGVPVLFLISNITPRESLNGSSIIKYLKQ